MATRQQRRKQERQEKKSPQVNQSFWLMDREARRQHYKENKNNPGAIFCPRCNQKTRHMAIPMDPKYAQSDFMSDTRIEKPADVDCNIVCVACGNVLRSYIRGVRPYEYVKEKPHDSAVT